MSVENFLRFRGTRLIVHAFTRFVSWLPLRVARWLGQLSGQIGWYVERGPARVTRLNIERCFGPGHDDLARNSLIETGKLVFETGVVRCWPVARVLTTIVNVDGRALIDEAVARGQSVVVLAPHLGNWEILGLYLGHEYGITSLYEPQRNAAVSAFTHGFRERTGARLVPTTNGGIRAVYRELEDGGVIALLPDQVGARSSGVYAPFYGNPALTMRLYHRLLRRYDSLPVMAYALREEAGFRVRFRPVGGVVSGYDLEASATALNHAIELAITEAPAQYQWEYRRFRRPPPGNPNPYLSES
jgi:KDO2-lipid IV(A) lauroyltransferase